MPSLLSLWTSLNLSTSRPLDLSSLSFSLFSFLSAAFAPTPYLYSPSFSLSLPSPTLCFLCRAKAWGREQRVYSVLAEHDSRMAAQPLLKQRQRQRQRRRHAVITTTATGTHAPISIVATHSAGRIREGSAISRAQDTRQGAFALTTKGCRHDKAGSWPFYKGCRQSNRQRGGQAGRQGQQQGGQEKGQEEISWRGHEAGTAHPR